MQSISVSQIANLPCCFFLCFQLHSFQAEDIKQDYDTGKDSTTMVTFKVDYDKVGDLEEAIRANCARDIVLYKQ